MSTKDKLKDWLAARKDDSISFVLEKVLRSRLEKYGQVLDFKLDTRRNSIGVKLLLKGEAEPLTVIVEEYELVADRGSTALVIKRATASREWIRLLAEEFLPGVRLPIPEKYAGLAKVVL